MQLYGSVAAQCTHGNPVISRTVSTSAKRPVNYEISENGANDIQKHLFIYISFIDYTAVVRVSWSLRSLDGTGKAPERGRE